MSDTAESIRVLHVAGESDFAERTATLLEREGEGITTERATSVTQALDLLAEYDCIVSEYDLPDENGIEFLRTVRERYSDLPFILCTDGDAEAIASRAVSAGVTDYFQRANGTVRLELLASRVRDAVARIRTEQRATDPEQRLRELTAASNDIHWMSTADWDETLFINDAYESIWGRSTDTLREHPRDFLDGIHPEDRDRARAAMDALSSGESIDIEFRVNASEDYRRRVWVQGEPIRDSSGEVVRVTGFARDVTDRVERRQRLEESEARFRTLAENFPNGGVHYFDEDLRYQFVSGSGFSHIDTSPDDLVDNTIYEVEPYSEEEIETLESVMQTTLDGNHESIEIPFEDRLFEIHSVPLRGENGSVTGGFFITQDITEQRERERELEARAMAMEASIDGMAILDDDEQYAYVNRAHADLYGYDDPEAFYGNSWQMCYDDAEREWFTTEVMPTLFAEGHWRGEAVGTRKDGSTFPQELSLSVTDDGRVICVVRDVSERKEREQRLTRQNERLEKFNSVLSHDLRGPLNVAKGRLQLAQEDCETPHLETVSDSLDRMEELLADLRTLARQGEDVGAVEAVELATVVENCWRTVKTAEATVEIATERTVSADRSRLRQVFENLFRNAIEHGGEDVTVRVGDIEGGFYVADDGPGIPPEDREQVFETGYSTAQSGTGYGLNIVAEIVAAHGWEITVKDSEAGGARFEITGVTAPNGATSS